MIFVTGPHAVGKTLLAEKLALEGFWSIDLGPTLRSIWQGLSPNIPFGEFVSRGENILGIHFTDDLLVQAVNRKLLDLKDSSDRQDLLIIGSRSPQGINYLKEHVLRHNGKDVVILYLDAPESVLHMRYCMRENVDISLEEFRAILEKDKKLGLEDIKHMADVIMLNDGRPEHYLSEIEGLIFGRLGYERQGPNHERKG
jgi:dephospho-CoA kinase